MTQTIESDIPKYETGFNANLSFFFGNNRYGLTIEYDEDGFRLGLKNISTGEVTFIPWQDDAYVLLDPIAETDNGYLFKLFPKEKPEWENRIVDGREIRVKNPPIVVYMTKENLINGNIVWEEAVLPQAQVQ